MLVTLPNERKSDWKSAIPSLVHAYNCTMHESTSVPPYRLMFGRTPRLALDAVLGLQGQSVSGTCPTDYMRQIETNLQEAYKLASKVALRGGDKAKHYYDRKVREMKLVVGDRVLLKNLGLKGKHKLSDIWSEQVYRIIDQPDPLIHVFKVQTEDKSGKIKTLHRNIILPLKNLPIKIDVSSESDTNSNISTESEISGTYKPPHRRASGEIGVLPRRSERSRKPPAWQVSGSFIT